MLILCGVSADKYLVCVEVAGRTKNDLCVALEGNMLKVRLDSRAQQQFH